MNLFGISLNNLKLYFENQLTLTNVITSSGLIIGFLILRKRTLKTILFDLGYKLVYGYTYLTMAYEKSIPDVFLASDQSYMGIELKKTTFFIKDNVDLIDNVETSDYSSADFVMCRKDSATIICSPNNFVFPKDPMSNFIREPCFLSMYICFDENNENDEKYEDNELKISLVTENDNFYVEGNRIDKYVLWYLVFIQYNINNYGKDYILKFVTTDFEQWRINSSKTIMIQGSSFVVI